MADIKLRDLPELEAVPSNAEMFIENPSDPDSTRSKKVTVNNVVNQNVKPFDNTNTGVPNEDDELLYNKVTPAGPVFNLIVRNPTWNGVGDIYNEAMGIGEIDDIGKQVIERIAVQVGSANVIAIYFKGSVKGNFFTGYSTGNQNGLRLHSVVTSFNSEKPSYWIAINPAGNSDADGDRYILLQKNNQPLGSAVEKAADYVDKDEFGFKAGDAITFFFSNRKTGAITIFNQPTTVKKKEKTQLGSLLGDKAFSASILSIDGGIREISDVRDLGTNHIFRIEAKNIGSKASESLEIIANGVRAYSSSTVLREGIFDLNVDFAGGFGSGGFGGHIEQISRANNKTVSIHVKVGNYISEPYNIDVVPRFSTVITSFNNYTIKVGSKDDLVGTFPLVFVAQGEFNLTQPFRITFGGVLLKTVQPSEVKRGLNKMDITITQQQANTIAASLRSISTPARIEMFHGSTGADFISTNIYNVYIIPVNPPSATTTVTIPEIPDIVDTLLSSESKEVVLPAATVTNGSGATTYGVRGVSSLHQSNFGFDPTTRTFTIQGTQLSGVYNFTYTATNNGVTAERQFTVRHTQHVPVRQGIPRRVDFAQSATAGIIAVVLSNDWNAFYYTDAYTASDQAAKRRRFEISKSGHARTTDIPSSWIFNETETVLQGVRDSAGNTWRTAGPTASNLTVEQLRSALVNLGFADGTYLYG